MGVWPPGAGLQGQASNHLMLLRSKDVVVSDEAKGGGYSRQMGDEKMSESEPLITHRKGFKTLSKRMLGSNVRTSVGGACLRPMRQPVHRRHDLVTGFNTERGNLTQCVRGGATHSSEEAAVMAVERRGCVVRPRSMCQPGRPGGAR